MYISRQQYEDMCKELIRDGTDQCRCALKRFGKRKEFRKAKCQLPKSTWKVLLENLDIRFDALDKQVESILRCARELLNECSEMNGYNVDVDIEYTVASDTDSDHNFADYSPDEYIIGEGAGPSPTIDRHAHATWSRKNDEKEAKRNNSEGKKETTKRQRRGNDRYRASVSKVSSSRHRSASKKQSINNRTRGHNGWIAVDQVAAANQAREDIVEFGSNLNRGANDKSKHRRSRERNEGAQTTRQRNDTNSDGTRRKAGGGNAPSDVNDDDEYTVMLTTQEYFESLVTSTDQPRDSMRENDRLISASVGVSSVFEACERLSSVFPDPSSDGILLQIPFLCEAPRLPELSLRAASITAFNTMLELLRKNGKHSLQEMIEMKSRALLPHIHLLRCTLCLMKRKLHLQLKPSDGIAHLIFSLKTKDSFLSLLMLQIIDVLYSQLLPKQWGSPRKLAREVYDGISILRDELGAITHCVEDFSQSIRRFPCQQWYKSVIAQEGKNPWYVSSIAPKSLEMFWHGDQNHGKFEQI